MHISHVSASPWAALEYDDIPFFDDEPISVALSDVSFNPVLLDDPLWGSAERRRRVHAMRRAAGLLLTGNSVARCGGYVSAATRDDQGRDWACVYRGERSAFFGHVISCGSVWHCPYCAARIAEKRRAEVAETMRRHMEAGGHVWMGTFTIPHHKFDDCKELREKLAQAFNKVCTGRPFARWKEAIGFVGSIRGMEVTHGYASGWHPHLHVLFFLDCHPRLAREFGAWLFKRWRSVVASLGLGECSEGAWNWRFCNSPDVAGEYVAKWGADWELTHGHLKLAKGKAGSEEKNRSPWEILQDWTVYQWPKDGELFREYALAFKGARQLTWSKGLKARYLLEDVTDQEVVDRLEDEEAAPVMAVEAPAVRQLKETGRTCQLLEAIERGGYEAGLNFMWGLGLHSFVAPPQKVLNGFFCHGNGRRYKSPTLSPKRANRREARPDTPQWSAENEDD